MGQAPSEGGLGVHEGRERILDAALRLFVLAGIENTPVSSIEAEAGLQPGSDVFVTLFSSKEAVFQAVVEREIDRALNDHLVLEMVDSSPLQETSVRIHGWLDGLDRHRDLMALLAREHGWDDLPDGLRTVMIDGWIAFEERAAENAGAADPRGQGAAVIAALLGYHLAQQFLGSPLGDIGRDQFVASLAHMIDGPG